MITPDGGPRQSSLNGRILEAAAARECNNERKYRLLYSHLLSKVGNLGLGAADRGGEYEAENAILERANSSLVNAAIGGVAVGIAAFVSMRYLPTLLVKVVGGESKAQALREADAASSGLRKGGALIIEASFGFWAGWRGYHMVGNRLGDGGTYEEISKIPLVRGRSALSDGLCRDWVDVTHNQIPPEFWHNLTHGEERCKLKDYGTWNAIRSFASNCVKRSRYEEVVRREWGLDAGPVSIPDPGVPEHFDEGPLSDREADMLVEGASEA